MHPKAPRARRRGAAPGATPPTSPRRGTRRTRGLAATAALIAVAVAVAAAPAAAAERVYEMVSPFEKGGSGIGTPAIEGDAHIEDELYPSVAAPDGSAVAFMSNVAFGDAHGSPPMSLYIARRHGTGWTTENVTLPVAYGNQNGNTGVTLDLVSSDVTATVQNQVNTGLPALTPDASTASPNIYISRLGHDPWELVTTSTPTTPGPLSDRDWADPVGASADLSHVVFQVRPGATLTPAVPGSPDTSVDNLYEYVDGSVRLVNVLPDGTAATTETELGSGAVGGSYRAISEDGSRIYFSTPSGNGVPSGSSQIYLREADASLPRTVHVSEPAPDAPAETTRGAVFFGASVDGSQAFFTSTQKLTADSTADAEGAPGEYGGDLYRYDVETETLTDLTIDPTTPRGADVRAVLGIAEDGSSLYFLAHGAPAPGGTVGEWNIYRWADDGSAHGVVTYVATVDRHLEPFIEYPEQGSSTGTWWEGDRFNRPIRVSPDGRYLAFVWSRSLTGFPHDGMGQAYLYDAEADGGDGKLTCASCNPLTGGPSTHPVRFSPYFPTGHLRSYEGRNLSSDGRLFFQTSEALVAEDINGEQDVYEYDDGDLRLISTGESDESSFFGSASVSGDDVFFLTSESLVPDDRDELRDVYTARVGGGFPAEPGSPRCDGDDCQGPASQAPTHRPPASSAFAGVGNPSAGRSVRAALRVRPVGRRARLRFARTGRLVLRVRARGRGAVVARVRARVGGRPRTVALARRRVRGRARTVRLPLRLSRPARRAFARRGRLRTQVTVSLRGAERQRTSMRLVRRSR